MASKHYLRVADKAWSVVGIEVTVYSNRGLSSEGNIVFYTINIDFPAEGSDIRYFMHVVNVPAEAAHLLTVRLA